MKRIVRVCNRAERTVVFLIIIMQDVVGPEEGEKPFGSCCWFVPFDALGMEC